MLNETNTRMYLLLFDSLLTEMAQQRDLFPAQAELTARLEQLNQALPGDEQLDSYVDQAIDLINRDPAAKARFQQLYREFPERYDALGGQPAHALPLGNRFSCPVSGCGYHRRLRMRSELPLYCLTHRQTELVRDV